MNRACFRGEEFSLAYAAIPVRVRERLGCDWLVGADPVFVGLHRFESTGETLARSYRRTGHCAYPWHSISPNLSDQRTTVVIPLRRSFHPATLVHELGHVLDEVTGFQWMADPVTAYAQWNRMEAFAEAFTAWVCPPIGNLPNVAWKPGYIGVRERLTAKDIAFFDALAL